MPAAVTAAPPVPPAGSSFSTVQVVGKPAKPKPKKKCRQSGQEVFEIPLDLRK
jgi:hypothetical protein